MVSRYDDVEARLRNGWIFSLLLGAPSVEGRKEGFVTLQQLVVVTKTLVVYTIVTNDG
jgi:hypothetical protein